MPGALLLSLSSQFSRQQIGFDREIVSTLYVAVFGCPLGLFHVALDLLDRILLVRAELTA